MLTPVVHAAGAGLGLRGKVVMSFCGWDENRSGDPLEILWSLINNIGLSCK